MLVIFPRIFFVLFIAMSQPVASLWKVTLTCHISPSLLGDAAAQMRILICCSDENMLLIFSLWNVSHLCPMSSIAAQLPGERFNYLSRNKWQTNTFQQQKWPLQWPSSSADIGHSGCLCWTCLPRQLEPTMVSTPAHPASCKGVRMKAVFRWPRTFMKTNTSFFSTDVWFNHPHR